MLKPRLIVNRRRTVRNIHKIARTMQLIATSKFHRAFERAVAGEPYPARLTTLLRHVTRTAGESIEHPLLKQREPGTDLLVVLTSNRGLCGGYNASILRIAAEHGRAQSARGVKLWLDVVGKKGINHRHDTPNPAR